ncbi:MAG: Ig-like domain-containing protein, partial [Methanomicrobiales archaeon]|nr:Ig-like domain-containing protein [Methanomicrobiales archaeon]
LTFKQVGGTIGDLHSWIIGSPEFSINERVLLFLTQNKDGTLRVAHLYQGKYSIQTDPYTKEEFARQEIPDGVHVMSPPTTADLLSSSSQRSHRFDEFKRELRRVLEAGGPPRESKPIVLSPNVASDVTQPGTSFTLMGNVRWFEPDAGSPVVMFTNQQGEPAAPTLGFSQAQQALAAWSNVSGASFKYQSGGTTAAVGFRSDGVNAISFGDPLGQMDNPVNCGGTLAQGGFFSTSGQSRVVNGQPFTKIIEGDVVVNDGWQGCGFYENFANLAEVLTHELGHVLGLGHSTVPSATMYAYAHFDGRGASLTSDDIAGLAFIYPATAPIISSVSASLVTSSGATITWTTDKASDSQVDYGTTSSYGGSTTLNATMVTSHSQTLSGLTANTLYHYRVKSKDVSGNLAVSGDFTFTTVPLPDTTPPTVSITAPSSGSTVSGSVAVSANASDNVGVSSIQFQLDGANLGAALTKAPYSISWNTASVGNGSHTLAAVAKDAAGNSNSASVTVTVSNSATTPAAITLSFNGKVRDRVGQGDQAVAPDSQMDGTFTVTLQAGSGNRTVTQLDLTEPSGPWWNTVAGDGRWVLGAANSLDGALLNNSSGAVNFGVADGGSFYIFGSDYNNMLFNSGQSLTLTAQFADGSSASANITLGAPPPVVDTTPPVISSVSAINISASGATIAWTTDKPTDSQVNYGAGAAYGSTTSLNSNLATSHSVLLTGLAANTSYHYQVLSRDGTGNLAVSGDFIFQTAPGGLAVQNVLWINLVNVTANGNSLQKTSGCDGCQDAGATSQQQIASGDGFVEFTASETTTQRLIGLSHNNVDTTTADIDFAIQLWADGGIDIRENGVYRTQGTYATGDVFRIAVESGIVKYYKNGALLYTSALAPSYPLLVDASLLGFNGTINNAVIAGDSL